MTEERRAAASTRPGCQGARLFPVLRLQVHATCPQDTLDAVLAWIDGSAREYVCFANVHGAIESWRDASVATAFAGAGLTVPDGMPLVWLGRLYGHPGVRRVYGPDLTLMVCAALAQRKGRVFLCGGSPPVAARMGEALTARFPGLVIAGVVSPPFRAVTAEEDREMTAGINTAHPDVVLVGLGCPKQERWMAAHRESLEAPVLLGVGAAFDFVAASVRQAPRWMMRAGLEWLFRLLQEPRRLWRRYLVYNPLFVALALMQLVASRGRGRPP
jgi:N-acetylglucosaminyldiphosphoundecaprenol N-acetyl-beta-D-mannosaminyltransferase